MFCHQFPCPRFQINHHNISSVGASPAGDSLSERIASRAGSYKFVVYPTHRRLKSRKVVEASRRLGERFTDWRQGKISFAEFDASVQGWINHVSYADSWGLRKHMLKQFKW